MRSDEAPDKSKPELSETAPPRTIYGKSGKHIRFQTGGSKCDSARDLLPANTPHRAGNELDADELAKRAASRA